MASDNQLIELVVDPPKFIILEIMPTGLYMLVGSPKVGKSSKLMDESDDKVSKAV